MGLSHSRTGSNVTFSKKNVPEAEPAVQICVRLLERYVILPRSAEDSSTSV